MKIKLIFKYLIVLLFDFLILITFCNNVSAIQFEIFGFDFNLNALKTGISYDENYINYHPNTNSSNENYDVIRYSGEKISPKFILTNTDDRNPNEIYFSYREYNTQDDKINLEKPVTIFKIGTSDRHKDLFGGYGPELVTSLIYGKTTGGYYDYTSCDSSKSDNEEYVKLNCKNRPISSDAFIGASAEISGDFIPNSPIDLLINYEFSAIYGNQQSILEGGFKIILLYTFGI